MNNKINIPLNWTDVVEIMFHWIFAKGFKSNRCLVKWLQWIIIHLDSLRKQRIRALKCTANIWRFLPHYIKYIRCTEAREHVSAASLPLNPFCKGMGSYRRSGDVLSVNFQFIFFGMNLCHDLRFSDVSQASQSWMKPAGAFDLRPLFSPNTSSPPEAKALIYIFTVLFFLLWDCAVSALICSTARNGSHSVTPAHVWLV